MRSLVTPCGVSVQVAVLKGTGFSPYVRPITISKGFTPRGNATPQERPIQEFPKQRRQFCKPRLQGLQIISEIGISSKSMATIFEKLNLKGHQEILVLRAPASFEPELARLPVVTIHHHLESVPQIRFALAFVTRKNEVDTLAPQIVARAQGDATIWFAYPKGTSKNYKCDFNRDTGWDALKAAGFDSVRAIAIDQDWTALRFRRKEFIKAR